MFVRACGVPDLHLLGFSAFISLARAQKNYNYGDGSRTRLLGELKNLNMGVKKGNDHKR